MCKLPRSIQTAQVRKRDLKKILAEMPINARVGYGIRCLERAFSHMAYPPNLYLLDAYKSFTNYKDVQWSIDIMSDILPSSILDNIPFEKKGMEVIDKKIHDDFVPYYQKCPFQIKEIIELVYHIAFDDFNTGIIYPSKDTLNAVSKIVEILKKNNVELPDIEEFSKYHFDQGGGRGVPFIMD